MLKNTVKGICAGIPIMVGCCVFLACENTYVGSVLFSVALLSICMKGYALFTGKVGYIAEKHGKTEISELLTSLLGNAIATCLLGLVLAYALPNLGEKANTICTKKLTQLPLQTFVRGCFCGILMYLAVSIYREKGTALGILFCIPAFILSGFEHSIADMGYFAMSGIVSWKAFGFIWMVILGNSVGGMLLPLLHKAAGMNK